MVLHPVGPEAPGIYWRRRLLSAALVLALVVLGARWAGRGTAAQTAAQTGPVGTAAVTSPTPAAPTPAGSRSPTRSEPTTTTATLTGAPTSAGPAPCADRDVEVVAGADAQTYPTGTTPHLELTVRNTARSACTRDLGPAALELMVTSGGKATWSSDDCKPAGSSDVRLVPAGSSVSQSVAWPRWRSAAGCSAPREVAGAGTYVLRARAGAVLSRGVVLTLR